MRWGLQGVLIGKHQVDSLQNPPQNDQDINLQSEVARQEGKIWYQQGC
jgi:hypothetical protein